MNISPTTRKWLGLIAIALGVAAVLSDARRDLTGRENLRYHARLHRVAEARNF